MRSEEVVGITGTESAEAMRCGEGVISGAARTSLSSAAVPLQLLAVSAVGPQVLLCVWVVVAS